ncbi:MAG TPA: Lrp/AsnC family transcriptional regulator [Chloroflexota bacterium]|jgi:Lrp/AsnC family leucine-responsive transcriptional regulator|nr:Lrp/AsnC family transcriptional regulator [Chloroflexota bacterium]
MTLGSALDEIDWRLLVALQENARVTFSELGRRVGLTAPAVAERVRRLEDLGIISSYQVSLNLERLGLPVAAVVRLVTTEGGCAAFAGVAPTFPEVRECHRVTGSDSYVLKVSLPSIQHLESLLDRLSAYGTTTTSLILSSPVTRRVVEGPSPVPGAGHGSDGRREAEDRVTLEGP